jgi:predicted nucleic acid-binding protein
MRVMQFAEKPSIIVNVSCGGKLAASVAPWLQPSAPQHMPSAPHKASPPASRVVLDTNVVLDLWLFGDPRVAALRLALQTGRLSALVTAPLLAELADVLQRPFAVGWPAAASEVQAALMAHACLVAVPELAGPPTPRCTDPDDQKFIDLAWHTPAAWLISRDRAVLKLARPALARGLQIVTPARWTALQPAG